MKLRKILTMLVTVALLCGVLAVFPVSAENRIVFLPTQTSNYTDGGWYAKSNEIIEAWGDEGVVISEGTFRVLWALYDSVANKLPYLIIEVDEGFENLKKFTVTHNFHSGEEKEIDLTGADQGPICINLFEFLREEESKYNSLYLTPYVTGRTAFKKFYLSDTDLDGNVYVPPTQPRPMWNEGGELVRFDLPAYTEDTLYEKIEDGKYGYGWLMETAPGVTPVKITNHEDGKGFWMERKEEYSNVKAANIAWVIPYEQLEKTPYLVFDIANEGRPDEGPQVNIYAYWEGIIGSGAYFDGVESTVGANGLNGVRVYNLKYAIDNVKEELHGPYGIALIVALDWSNERSDGTVLDPLMINDVYLAGWEGGEPTEFTLQEVLENGGAVPTTPTQSTQTTTTVANQNDDDNDDKAKDDNGWIVWVIVGAVVVIGVVAAVVVIKKKK